MLHICWNNIMICYVAYNNKICNHMSENPIIIHWVVVHYWVVYPTRMDMKKGSSRRFKHLSNHLSLISWGVQTWVSHVYVGLSQVRLGYGGIWTYITIKSQYVFKFLLHPFPDQNCRFDEYSQYVPNIFVFPQCYYQYFGQTQHANHQPSRLILQPWACGWCLAPKPQRTAGMTPK